MPETYQDYLAANVLNQGAIISYRSLSRALKVHSNAAKQMLYDFHHTQNARKPGSVHATYLVAGSLKPQPQNQPNGTHHADGEDTLMSDPSFMMSSSLPTQEDDNDDPPENVPVTSVSLIPEEQLIESKALYENITSIHIYSLEPGPLSNIQILSDCNRKIAVDYASEDPLETWKQYGTIHNPNAKRRTTRRPPPPPAAAQAQAPPAVATSRASETSKPAPSKTPAQPKRESSDLFKSFAKAKSNGQQPTGAHSNAPGTLVPSKPEQPTAEDESMKDIPDLSSEADDEADDEPDADALQQSAAANEKAAANRKARAEREAHLRQMMEQDDDDDDGDGDAASDRGSGQDPQSPADADGDAAMTEPDHPAPAEDHIDEQQAQVTVSDGRRRGRRRVMKKKTTKDAEGYLVTKEEPVWESFSEDEPVAATPAATVKAKPAASAGAAAKGKSSTGKTGQGNIMSFFGKK